MKILFEKYQGTGNDFIIIEKSQKLPEINPQLIQRLCDRRFGIGADGVIFIGESKDYDFDMFYYNADGSASFCGNGSRCAVMFARKKEYFTKGETIFNSNDGVHTVTIHDGLVKLQMHDVDEAKNYADDLIINTGSPHYIQKVENVDNVNVFEQGRAIRESEDFKKEGINVNFLEMGENKIKIRTYERGVEAETLSCGTGVTACALAANFLQPKIQSPVLVETKGGNLKVYFEQNENSGFKNIYLEGAAEFVFSGEIEN